MMAPEHGRRPTATMAVSPRFHQSRPASSLGSGAYRVKTFEQGRTIEYELRDDYWGRDLPIWA